MLDTDTVSYALRGQGGVDHRLKEVRPSEVRISAVSLAELCYGVELRKSRRLRRLIDAFVETVSVLQFDDGAARMFGRVAAELAAQGAPIGQLDALIAAHALSRRLTIVTNDTKHFSRVKGLRTVNWVEGST